MPSRCPGVEAGGPYADTRLLTAEKPRNMAAFDRVIPAGNVLTVEASLVDEARPGSELSWCGVYTFDGEGRVVSDHSYLNHRDWPGTGDVVGG